jgi:hypothetical protein
MFAPAFADAMLIDARPALQAPATLTCGKLSTYIARTVDRRSRPERFGIIPHNGAAQSPEARLLFAMTRVAQQGGVDNEENLPAEPLGSQATARLPPADVDEERTQGARQAAGQGAQAPVGLTGLSA